MGKRISKKLTIRKPGPLTLSDKKELLSDTEAGNELHDAEGGNAAAGSASAGSETPSPFLVEASEEHQDVVEVVTVEDPASSGKNSDEIIESAPPTVRVVASSFVDDDVR